ncbi:MAG: hypothetical protein K9M44_00235 [Candidatus Pacebacteria bacterium]|nr:hypothetical protein [Candidatus Paceibacterota bacterium]
MAVVEGIKQDLRSSQWNVSTGSSIGQTFNSGSLNNISKVSFYQVNNNYTGSYGIEMKIYRGIGGDVIYTDQRTIPQNNGVGWKEFVLPEPLQIDLNAEYFVDFKVTSGFWSGAPYRTGDAYPDGVMTYNKNPYTDGKDTMFIIWHDDEFVPINIYSEQFNAISTGMAGLNKTANYIRQFQATVNTGLSFILARVRQVIFNKNTFLIVNLDTFAKQFRSVKKKIYSIKAKARKFILRQNHEDNN